MYKLISMYYSLLSNIRYVRYVVWWRFLNLWLFQWKVDQDGDIAFVIFNRLAFVKYKQSTIINLKGDQYSPAKKYLNQ